MYEALVARVRYHIQKANFMGLKEAESTLLLAEAADAIEELSAQLLEMGQAGKFLLDAHKINCKMIDPDTIPTDSEWWAKYKALLELLYIPRWIPVTERLPEDGQWVLVWGHGQKIPIMMFRESGAWIDDQFEFHTAVTHWMPLPEPPKEE